MAVITKVRFEGHGSSPESIGRVFRDTLAAIEDHLVLDEHRYSVRLDECVIEIDQNEPPHAGTRWRGRATAYLPMALEEDATGRVQAVQKESKENAA